MRRVALGGLLLLAGCGGGGTTGTNYSDPPPMAEIVGTPAPLGNSAREAAPDAMLSNMAGDNATAPTAGLPADVTAFQEKRDACDHWRGEEGYDADRKKEIADAIAKNCTGTDAELARLKAAHKGDVAVQKLLAEYDAKVE